MSDDPSSPTVQEVNAHFIEVYPAAAGAGIRCESIGERTAVARWTFDETQLRPGRYISGPTMFSLADTALWFAVFSVIGIESMAVTSEMSIRFVRPALDGDLMATATADSVARKKERSRPHQDPQPAPPAEPTPPQPPPEFPI